MVAEMRQEPSVSGPRTPWSRNARQWSLIGPPLRPGPEDVVGYEAAVREWHGTAGRPPRALLMGVTPEIATMRWPDRTEIVAIDHSLPMILSVWPGPAVPVSGAACGDWTRLPLADGSRDLAIGDGCLSAMRFPEQYEGTLQAVHRVLAPGGRLVLRFFCRPETGEQLENVFDDLWAGRIGNFHVFKWRFAMAVHGTLAEGVILSELWRIWKREVPEPGRLAERLGWPIDVIGTIDAYRDVASRYTFPTLPEAKAVLATRFEVVGMHQSGYELGDRCPILVSRPK